MRLLFISTALGLCGASAAWGQNFAYGSPLSESRLYVQSWLGQGLSSAQSNRLVVEENALGAQPPLDIDFEREAVTSFGAGLGISLPNTPLRFEAGVSHLADFDFEVELPEGQSLATRANSTIFDLSAYADLNLTPTLKPYVGGGVGYAWNVASPVSLANVLNQSDPDRQTSDPAQGGSLAWHLDAGLGLQLTNHSSFVMGYRYTHAGEQTLGDSFSGRLQRDGADADTSGTLNWDAVQLASHELRVGMRHNLGREQSKAHAMRSDVQLESHYGLGFGALDLNYITAGLNGPDVKAENEFSDMTSVVFSGDWLLGYDRVVVDAASKFGWIIDGETKQAVYQDDGRTNPSMLATGLVNDDFWYTTTLGLGMEFASESGRGENFILRPMVGGGWSQQRLRFGKTEIEQGSYGELPTGSVLPDSSTYDARWLTGWLGGEAELVGPDYRMTLRGELHRGVYDAQARFDQALDLPQPISLAHNSDAAYGTRIAVRGERDWGPSTRFFLGGSWENFYAVDGDTLAGNAAGSPQLDAKFKQAEATAYTITAGVVMGF